MDLVEILSFLFQLSFSTLGRVSAHLLVSSMLDAEWEGFGLCSFRIIQWRAWATHCWPSCSTYGSLDLSFRERWGIPWSTLVEPKHTNQSHALNGEPGQYANLYSIPGTVMEGYHRVATSVSGWVKVCVHEWRAAKLYHHHGQVRLYMRILHLHVRHCNLFPSEEVAALLSHQTGHHTSHRWHRQLPAHPHSQLGLNSCFGWLWLHRGGNKLPHLRLHQ